MSNYLPIIVSAIVIFTALMWWLLALGSVKKDSRPTDIAPPKAMPAPPVAAAPPPAAPAKLMDDPKPSSKTAPPKSQAPLKAAATKKAPTRIATPAAKKATAPKAASAPKAVAPKAATAKVSAPKPVAAPKPKAAAKPSVPDNLLLLKGVGPKVSAMLKDMGVTSFAQIANWSAADISEIDPKLGAFAGRIGRDNWVDQARFLASGDTAGFEKKYGALGSENKS